MVEPADRPSTAGQRLGATESFGVSTLEPGMRPPNQPPGRLVSIRVQMLDDTQEVFQISVSASAFVENEQQNVDSCVYKLKWSYLGDVLFPGWACRQACLAKTSCTSLYLLMSEYRRYCQVSATPRGSADRPRLICPFTRCCTFYMNHWC